MNKRVIWLIVFFSVLIWSAIGPKDQFTWFLEVLPALIALPVLFFTRNRFPMSPLAYLLILIHCVILMVGGHYTYAEVPFFDWISQLVDGDRNNYDKLGHLAQGFVPVILAREIFIRREVVKLGHWCNFLAVCFALAFSAFYELLEWWVALLTGEDAEAFLGTQGYIWDTQSDMGMALLGAIVSLLVLSRYHDKQIDQLRIG
ncbi:DUF2238 domain-containing protein [Shewanella canadensis]|uniref:DUF2238 domain-containing protein n=1 Tax=Shewanella canadensis TaxID=271096 RepID=A0A431WXT8_9GAMM|nr:DUF2238 domain-containing protein [Shewanella canadensis]RTR40238.1 DUF2238 domain-containing protein [Shewanella canadensis]